MTNNRMVKLSPAVARTGPRLAPMNRTKPLIAMPLPRRGAAACPNSAIMAGTARAMPVTKTRLASPRPIIDSGARASATNPRPATRKPVRVRPVLPPSLRVRGPAASATNMPGRPASRSANTVPGSCPRAVRCMPRPVYMATKDNRSVRCAAHRNSTSPLEKSWTMVRNCWPSPPGDGARPGSRTSRAIDSMHSASRQALPKNTQLHPNRSATACAPICPTIPATRKAVDIAPIAVARCLGVTASLR